MNLAVYSGRVWSWNDYSIFLHYGINLLWIMMCNIPLGVAEPPHPETLHVQYGTRVNQQFAIIGLGDWPFGIPEQDCWRFLHWNK